MKCSFVEAWSIFEDEGDLQMDPVLADLALRADGHFLVLNPGRDHVLEGLVGAGYASLEGIIETDGRRGFDFGNPGNRHGIPPSIHLSEGILSHPGEFCNRDLSRKIPSGIPIIVIEQGNAKNALVETYRECADWKRNKSLLSSEKVIY